MSTCFYYTKPCSECGGKIKVIINIGLWPSETTWQIGRGDVIVWEGGLYSQSYYQYNTTKCLSYGAYTFAIYDNDGDSMTYCLMIIFADIIYWWMMKLSLKAMVVSDHNKFTTLQF